MLPNCYASFVMLKTLPFTVTVYEHSTDSPPESVAVHVIVFSPSTIGLLSAVHTTDGSPPSLSVAVGFSKSAEEVGNPSSVGTSMSTGHVICGGSSSVEKREK